MPVISLAQSAGASPSSAPAASPKARNAAAPTRCRRNSSRQSLRMGGRADDSDTAGPKQKPAQPSRRRVAARQPPRDQAQAAAADASVEHCGVADPGRQHPQAQDDRPVARRLQAARDPRHGRHGQRQLQQHLLQPAGKYCGEHAAHALTVAAEAQQPDGATDRQPSRQAQRVEIAGEVRAEHCREPGTDAAHGKD